MGNKGNRKKSRKNHATPKTPHIKTQTKTMAKNKRNMPLSPCKSVLELVSQRQCFPFFFIKVSS